MRNFAALFFCMLFSFLSEGQIPISLDSVVGEVGFFSVDDSVSIDRIKNGEQLHVWSWRADQIKVNKYGEDAIRGYSKNFDIHVNSTITFNVREGYNAIPCNMNWCVWATIDQPFGHRPPLLMNQVEEAIMINRDCPVLKTANTRTVNTVEFRSWQTVITNICVDTLTTTLNANGELIFDYSTDDDYGAYTFKISSGAYWNNQEMIWLEIYKLNNQFVSNIILDSGGYFVSSNDHQTIIKRPSSTKITGRVYAWKTNPVCPSPIDHWPDGTYKP